MQLRDFLDFTVLMYEPLFPVHVFFFFLLGALWGSFCNVAIYRMPVGQSTVSPRSFCYSCGTMISGWDNIPLISYLVLRGRCRTCRTGFSARYAGVEFLSGCLYLALFLQYRFCWALPLYFVFSSLLLIATFTDVDHWIILDRISLGGFVAGVFLALAMNFIPDRLMDHSRWVVAHSGPYAGNLIWGPMANALVGACVGAGILWSIGFIGSVIFRKPAMGFGDVKLMLLIGAFGGWMIGLFTIFLASFFGLIWGGFAMLISMLSSSRGKTVDKSKEVLEETGNLNDRMGQASQREQAFLLRFIVGDSGVSAKRRRQVNHLPFGPHLALAAWVLLITEPRWINYVNEVLELFKGY